MTLMLASVVDAVEAKLAADGGVDVIDFCDPRRGALGAVPVETIAAAVATIGGKQTVSAACGGEREDAETLVSRARALSAAGVETLRMAADPALFARLRHALPALAKDICLVGVLFADRNPDFGALERLSALGFRGALLDAAEKGGKRLLDHLPPARIEAFCRRCRELGLATWLAGSLQSPDVPRLLIVEPDVLGFRSALCRRDGPLDPRRIALIRDLIPRDSRPGAAGAAARAPSAGNDESSDGGPSAPSRPLRSRREAEAPARPDESPNLVAPAAGAVGAAGFDSIFVRDFMTTAEIGAYAHERGVKQRLMFNIDAAVRRVAAHVDDLRAIVSYDVILDAVRIATGRGHIDFIETVAEEVAAIVLRHPRVARVRVRVEKLDVVAGSVGVEIVRRRAKAAVAR